MKKYGLLLLLVSFWGFSSLPAEEKSGEEEPGFSLPDLAGEPLDPLDPQGKKAAVVFFVSPYCPTSNNFAPAMNEIVVAFGGDFTFSFVHSDPDVSEPDRVQHASLMEFDAPVLHDAELAVAKHLGATITPEVAVVDAEGETVYRGRINDWYLSPTRRQREVTSHDLREALSAIRAGEPVAEARTEAMGCRISGVE